MRFLSKMSKKKISIIWLAISKLWGKFLGLKRRFKICILLLILLVVIFLLSLPRALFQSPYSVVVQSANGNLLSATIAADEQWRFPPCDSVPYKFKKALITYEDKRFNYHFGVDIFSTSRALLQNMKQQKIVSGGSTITMQVIRLMRKNKPRTVFEKIIETILATRLELTYSKKEILALYASNAPFGGNVVGLDAAAWRYFGRSAKDLSWAEAATIAVLPNAPSLINVYKNTDRLLEKRNALLQQLFAAHIINQQSLELAQSEPLPTRPYPLPMYAYHLGNTISRAASQSVIVTTTLNGDWQKRISQIAMQKQKVYSTNLIDNVAILVSHVRTGKILAYVGNVYQPNDKHKGSNVDVIVSPRSSGSVLKPLLYATMLDNGEILPNMLVSDIPFQGNGFSPQNYNRTFDGAVPAHRVLERSLNVPSVKMLQTYGIEKFQLLLKQLGFTTINRQPDDYGLTLILGGAECTLWDLVNVYTKMAQKMNTFNNPTQSIVPIHYYPNAQLKKENATDFPLSNAAIWLSFESLSNLNRPEEESEWQSFSLSRKVAWKTGTSYGNRDAWSIGITPDYVVGVWVGNASGEGRPNLIGIEYAAPVMFEVFSLLPHTGWFSMPEIEMTQVAVCKKSGYLASTICPATDKIWIPEAGLHTPSCPFHIEVMVSRNATYRVNTNCERIENMKHEVFFVLPPAQEWYYKTKNSDYRTLPPVDPRCGMTEGHNPMELIYPQANNTIVIPRKLDQKSNAVVFEAAHHNPQAIIFWHIDGNYIGQTQHKHQMAINPPSGNHILTLVDHEGFSLQRRFKVE